MRKSFLILLSLIVLTPVIATIGADVGERTEELRNFVSDFLIDFEDELASLSIAAVAAVGLQMGLKKYSKLADDRSVNVVTITIFVAMFLMVYSSGLYDYFIPFIGYLVISGLGIILFSMYQGLHENGVEPLDKVVGAGGCFFLAWFAIMSGIPEAGILLGIVGFVLLLMALKGAQGFFGSTSDDDNRWSLFGDRNKRTRTPRTISDDVFNNRGLTPENAPTRLKKIQEWEISLKNELLDGVGKIVKLFDDNHVKSTLTNYKNNEVLSNDNKFMNALGGFDAVKKLLDTAYHNWVPITKTIESFYKKISSLIGGQAKVLRKISDMTSDPGVRILVTKLELIKKQERDFFKQLLYAPTQFKTRFLGKDKLLPVYPLKSDISYAGAWSSKTTYNKIQDVLTKLNNKKDMPANTVKLLEHLVGMERFAREVFMNKIVNFLVLDGKQVAETLATERKSMIHEAQELKTKLLGLESKVIVTKIDEFEEINNKPFSILSNKAFFKKDAGDFDAVKVKCKEWLWRLFYFVFKKDLMGGGKDVKLFKAVFDLAPEGEFIATLELALEYIKKWDVTINEWQNNYPTNSRKFNNINDKLKRYKDLFKDIKGIDWTDLDINALSENLNDTREKLRQLIEEISDLINKKVVADGDEYPSAVDPSKKIVYIKEGEVYGNDLYSLSHAPFNNSKDLEENENVNETGDHNFIYSLMNDSGFDHFKDLFKNLTKEKEEKNPIWIFFNVLKSLCLLAKKDLDVDAGLMPEKI